MRTNKRLLVVIAILTAILMLAGCSKDDTLSYDGFLTFTGLENDLKIAYNDIYAMEPITRTVTHLSSDGEESTNEVTGVLLERLLNDHDLSQENFSSIRFIADDGYAIDVPAEIVAEKDIILAYKFDDEYLEDKKMPLRTAIDGTRSMYFASNLVEIQFGEPAVNLEDNVELNKIIILETAYKSLETQPFTYYESEDIAVKCDDLFNAYVDNLSSKIYMSANDGYDKTENLDVIRDGFIKITGKDAPLFTGKDLPKGMNVKYLMNLQAGNISFVSVESALETLETKTIDDISGIPLDAFVEMSSLSGDNYIITSEFDYSVEVSADSLNEAVIYMHDEAGCSIEFAASYPKSLDVKSILSIEPAGNTDATADENTESADDSTTANAPSWTITFDGLSDGSFDLTSEKAQRKLELTSVETNRMKNDEVKTENWKGYKLLDVLSFLHVDDFESVIITAGDGYAVELTKELIDDETILAVEKNGESLTDDDNLVQLIQNTEFATTWVKGVATVLVK